MAVKVGDAIFFVRVRTTDGQVEHATARVVHVIDDNLVHLHYLGGDCRQEFVESVWYFDGPPEHAALRTWTTA